MTSPLKEIDDTTLAKVVALLSRAGHPSTPGEEARESALVAAQLIYTHGLIVTSPRRVEPPKPPPPAKKDVRHITSRFDGRCRACDLPYDKGELIAWCREEGGATHYDCRDYWAAQVKR